MSCSPGSRLGPYEILGAIGAGGMGEVFKAKDTRLGRSVAIKVLPALARQDPERRQRFEREARAVAALNHPNICALFDIGHEGDVDYLVMELVEGESLADRLARGPLPIDQALRYAAELASALDRAHRQAIIHRDLKPGNIILTKSGAKLLDFGLAKLRPAVGGADAETVMPTQLSDRTAAGTILGTLQYMSPEQLEGADADARSDIFAFGAVLFEMVTGKKAFDGKSQASVISAIMSSAAPSISAVQPLAPASLDRIVSTCLAKDPDDRWQTAADLGRELRWIGKQAKPSSAPVSTEQVASTIGRISKTKRATNVPVVAWTIMVVAALGVVAVLGWNASHRGPTSVSYVGTQFTSGDFAQDPRVSPNGSLVALQVMVDGQTQLAVMQPESGDVNVLTHDRTRGALSSYSWSPDGTRIYYGRVDGVPRGVFSISAVGGEERLVLEDAVCPQALPDGSLVVAKINENRQYQVYRYIPDTRSLRPYDAFLESDVDYTRILAAFRDGKDAAFWGWSADALKSNKEIALQRLNLSSGVVTELAPVVSVSDRGGAIAIAADDQSVVTVARSGDLATVIQVPRAGGSRRELLSLTESITGVDVAPNGDVYVDQMSRPLNVTRINADGTGVTPLLTFAGMMAGNHARGAGSLSDGRLVFPVDRNGRRQLVVMAPGQNPQPVIQTQDETDGPIAPAGPSGVAFLLGPTRTLAIASAADGRITHRLVNAHPGAIAQVASMPDGKTLYYAAAGKIWSIAAADDAKPVAVRDGEAVAVDPRGDALVIQLNEANNVRFVRRLIATGVEQPLSFPDVRLTTTGLSAGAIGPGGIILKNANYADSWVWNLALLDPAAGKSRRVVILSQDVQSAAWTPSGQIIVFASRTTSTIWRMRVAK